MLDSLIPLLIIGLSIGVAAWLVFMWAVKSGQFDDIEGPKHRMLDDDDDVNTGDAAGKKGGVKDEGSDDERV